MSQPSPQTQQKLTAIQQRWGAFAHKVQTRVESIVVEAGPAVDQLIAEHSTDYSVMGSTFQALKTRFRGIDNRIDKGSDDCAELLEELDEAFYAGAQVTQLGPVTLSQITDPAVKVDKQWVDHVAADLSRQGEELSFQVALKCEVFCSGKRGHWARQLLQRAQAERSAGAPCSNCGSPLVLEVFWQASNVSCPHCKTLQSCAPGAAASVFYQGGGAEALADEAAINESVQARHAEKKFDGYRYPTAYDRWAVLQAVGAYYQKYCEVLQQVHPGTIGSLEENVQARVSQLTADDDPEDVQRREFFGQLLDVARKGDPAPLAQLFQQRPEDIDTAECAMSILEHGCPEGARLLYSIKHGLSGKDSPQDKWVAKKMRALREELRTR